MSGASLAGQPSPRFDATWTWNGLRMSSRGLGCAAAVVQRMFVLVDLAALPVRRETVDGRSRINCTLLCEDEDNQVLQLNAVWQCLIGIHRPFIQHQ